MAIERRISKDLGVEIRAAEGSNTQKIVGYSATFNNEITIDLGMWGSFRESIRPGAFDDVMNQDVRALFNHDPNMVIGRTKNKTLVLTQDARGLFMEVTPPSTTVGQDVIELVKRGDVSGQSFAFTIAEEEWDYTDDVPSRQIIKVETLYDVGPVTYPAYEEGTTAQLRSVLEHGKEVLKNKSRSTVQVPDQIKPAGNVAESSLPFDLRFGNYQINGTAPLVIGNGDDKRFISTNDIHTITTSGSLFDFNKPFQTGGIFNDLALGKRSEPQAIPAVLIEEKSPTEDEKPELEAAPAEEKNGEVLADLAYLEFVETVE